MVSRSHSMAHSTHHPGLCPNRPSSPVALKAVISNKCCYLSRNKRGQLKTSYKGPNVNANLDVDSAGGPAIRGAAVVG